CAAFGVNNICSGLPSAKIDEAWSVDGLSKLRDVVASHGISLDMVPLPMSSSEISRAELPAIYLGTSPDRDRSIDEICDVIRYCGSRKKIFSVHFRNIEGGFLNFRETFIDNGSVDMLKAMRVYKEVGYDGMLMPDHVPQVEGVDSNQGFAYAFGYIKALIAAVSAET